MMVRFLLFYFSLFASILATYGQEYSKGANSIVMSSSTFLKIESEAKYEFGEKYIIKVLNPFAKNEREVLIYYNEFSKVTNATIELLDGLNNTVEKFSLKDMNDVATGGSSPLTVASDSRAKYLKVGLNTYPYFIKVSYTSEHKGSLHYPTWSPQWEEKMAVKSASFTITNNTSSPVRYLCKNISPPEIISASPTIYRWQIDSLAPLSFENYSTGIDAFTPVVYTAPSSFKIANVSGNMSSWNEFGLFINALNDGKNNLSEIQKQELKSLVSDDDDVYTKVKKVYSYLQENTRYVSIQLGIGGWAPFDASFVHEKKYGDCKALSFYTKSALKVVGVESYYTLIKATSNADPIFEEFPNASFNHAIVTVPMENDTLWLECTSQTNPIGYLSTHTGNRKALLIHSNGAEIINTKHYSSNENLQSTITDVILDEKGIAGVIMKRNFAGLEIDNDRFFSILRDTKETQTKWFYDNLNIGDLENVKFEIKELISGVVPQSGFECSLTLLNGAIANSNRLFFRPARFTNIDHMNLSNAKRNSAISIKYGYSQIDTLSVVVPQGYSPESIMESVEFSNLFGSYTCQVLPSERGFQYVRKFVLNSGYFEVEKYTDFYEFIKKVQKTDRLQMVFLNKT